MAILPARQVHILCGASGAGKTTLLEQAIANNEAGIEFPIGFEHVETVNYVVADRTAEETEKRAKTLGIKGMSVYGIADDKQLALSLLDHPDMLFREVTKKFGRTADLLVLDPIMLFMDDEARGYACIARSLIRMARYCIDNNVTCVATHHAVKTRTDFSFLRPQDRISGSAAFQGFSGTQMVIIEGKETGEDFDRFVCVPHLSPPEEYKLVRDDAGFFSVQHNEAVHQIRAMLQTIKGLLIPKQQLHNAGAIHGLHQEEIDNLLDELGVKAGPKGFYQKV